jgi:hypothetical protein
LNGKDDELSKEAMSLPLGTFGLYEFIDSEEIEATKVFLLISIIT